MRKIVYILFFVLFSSACATFNPSKEVFKEKASYKSKSFSVPGSVLHKTIVKVIYTQSFIIEKEDKENGSILAKRCFQKGKRNIILILQAKIIPETAGSSTLYLNALQTTERLFVADRTRFFLWIIPLPGGGGKEATKIKEREKMIEDKEFYQRFFKEIEEELSKSKVEKNGSLKLRVSEFEEQKKSAEGLTHVVINNLKPSKKLSKTEKLPEPEESAAKWLNKNIMPYKLLKNNGGVEKSDFSKLEINNVEELFSLLINNNYINKKGIVQDALVGLKDASGLNLEGYNNDQKQQIYNILRQRQRIQNLLIRIKQKYNKELSEFSDEELKRLAKTPQGQELKKLILRLHYPDKTPKSQGNKE